MRVARHGWNGGRHRLLIDDAELGWVHSTGHEPVSRRNSCGEEVMSPPPPTPYIVRQARETTGVRVLFLGDSTTHAHEVSSGDAFYDVVEKAGGGRYAVWAAGVGGYGSLQEHLLLQRIYQEVRPDIVVWQLDGNDIANNVPDLDYGVLNNNVQPRPYLDPSTGRITKRPPTLWIFRASEAARSLLSLAIGADRAMNLGVLERFAAWVGPAEERLPALKQQGLAVLDAVVGSSVAQYPGTRFVGFSVSRDEDDAFGAIFRRHGASYWPGVAARVAVAGVRTDCAPLDTHWNRDGNRVAGEILAALLSETPPASLSASTRP